jgi:FkbM family methyltransferase
MSNRALSQILNPDRLTHIVDIGANPIDGEPPYQGLLADGLCRVTGFEPQPEPLAALNGRKSANETYLPYAIGDGDVHQLNLCRYSGWTSTLLPSRQALEVFSYFESNAEVVGQSQLRTRRLDDVAELADIDFLKIDIQGGELAALRNASAKLRNAVAVQTEISFVALYEKQPTFDVVDGELRRQGFVPHCFVVAKSYPYSPMVVNKRHLGGAKQLLEADILYVRDYISQPMPPGQLKHLCLIAHCCYSAFDLALRCLMRLEEADAIAAGSVQRYLELLVADNALMPA